MTRAMRSWSHGACAKSLLPHGKASESNNKCELWRTHLWNQSHTTHHLGFVKVEYRWHPHFGLTIAIRRPAARKGEQLVCELPDGTLSMIPRWMTDAAACASLSVGRPLASVTALRELRELVAVLAHAKPSTPAPELSCRDSGGRP